MSHNLLASPPRPILGVAQVRRRRGVAAGVPVRSGGRSRRHEPGRAHRMLHPHPFWDNSSKTEYLKSVTKQLDLTPEQAAQMASILDDFAKYYQTVLSDGKARIFNILNEEQKRKFEKMLKERPRN
jgi:hypothetical protein